MKLSRFVVAAVFALSIFQNVVAADMNFSGARSIEINECPHVDLSGFTGTNSYDDRRRSYNYKMNLAWQNKSAKSIVAMEINVARYDAFNRHVTTRRWTITGHDSANWSALKPGEGANDGTIGYSTEDHYTSFAYVTAIRFDDNTVWRYDSNKVAARIKAELPGLKEIGNLDGERQVPEKK